MVRLHKLAFFASICAVTGFVLVFLPQFVNPAFWYSSTATLPPGYEFIGYFVLPGLLLFIVGVGLLLYSMVVLMRSKNMQARRAKTFTIYKKAYRPALAGAIAYWLTGIAMSFLPIPTELRLPWSVQNLFGTFVAGIIVGISVSYYLIWYFHRVTVNSTVLKSVFLGFFALIVIGILETLFHLSEGLRYLAMFVTFDSPRFIILGAVVGYVYVKLYGETAF